MEVGKNYKNMNIKKELEKKEKEFEKLSNKKQRLEEEVQHINQRLLILKGEYNILKEMSEDKD